MYLFLLLKWWQSSMKCTVPFSFAVPLFSLAVIHCHLLSLFVTHFHSLSLVVPLVVTRCTTCCHSLPLVVPLVITRCTTCCHSLYHSLSFVVTRCHSMYRLVCLFINDRNILLLLISYCKSKVYSFLSTLAINAIK